MTLLALSNPPVQVLETLPVSAMLPAPPDDLAISLPPVIQYQLYNITRVAEKAYIR